MAEITQLLTQYEAKDCAGSLKKSLLENEWIPTEVTQCLNEQQHAESHLRGLMVLHWLCDLQKQQVDELRVFVLQFLPNVVMLYVQSSPDMEFNDAIESCLRNYLQMAEKFKIFEKSQAPHLGRPSVFHKPSSEVPQPLTVSALQKHDCVDLDPLHKRIDFKNITEDNRLSFLNALVQVYIFYISSLSRLSHLQYCHLCTRLSVQGMHYAVILVDTCTSDECIDASQLDKLSFQKRHKMSSALLCSLLLGVQKILFQYVNPSARQSLKAMDMRAKYELYPAAIQLSRSIRTLMEHVRSSKVNFGFSEEDTQFLPMDVSIDGVQLTNPKFSRCPMVLSLLKFHSPSVVCEDDICFSPVAVTAPVAANDTVQLNDSNSKETQV